MENTPATAVTPAPARSLWGKTIPSTNRAFLIITLVLLCTLDAFLGFSDPMLFGFFMIMVASTAVFTGFFCFEQFVLKKSFENSRSKLDGVIYAVIIIRNIIFFLNVIPFIQIFGMMIAIYIGIPYLIIYGILIGIRYSQSKEIEQPSV